MAGGLGDEKVMGAGGKKGTDGILGRSVIRTWENWTAGAHRSAPYMHR